MDALINFLLHHERSVADLFLSLLLLASSIHLTVYKKRHNNELPPWRVRIVVIIILIVFGGYCLGVMASLS